MRARDFMTANPVTVAPQARIAEAWDLMRELEIRHMPVVADGALVGMLSDRDLAHLDMTSMLTLDTPEVLRQELATPIAKVMHPDASAIQSIGIQNPVVGLYSKTNAERASALNQKMGDGLLDIIFGRSDMNSFDQLVKDWRGAGGDQIRTEFEQALQGTR